VIRNSRLLLLADQAASSLSNFLAILVAAHTLAPSKFGQFSFLFLMYTILVGLLRTLVLVPWFKAGRVHPDFSSLFFMVSCVCLPLSLVAAATTYVLGNGVPEAVALVIGCLPLVWVDQARYFFLLDGRSGTLLCVDVVWGAFQVGSFVCLHLFEPPGQAPPWLFFYAFAGSALLAFMIAVRNFSRAPHIVRRSRQFAQLISKDSLSMTIDYLFSTGTLQVTNVIASPLFGVSAVGGLRGAQALVGPISSLTMGVESIALSEASRETDPKRRFRRLMRISAALCALVLPAVIFMMFVPAALGRLLLGASWPLAAPLVGLMGIRALLGCLELGAHVGLRIGGHSKKAAKLRLFTAPFQLFLPIVCGLMGGVVAFVWGSVLGTVIECAAWWGLLYTHRSGDELDLRDRPQPAYASAAQPEKDSEEVSHR
jgi:O-antigen/teichoic acid export membrane protein